MARSTEIDTTTIIRDAMIERRNKALMDTNFDDAVLFSHVIAALAYCLELEEKESKRG